MVLYQIIDHDLTQANDLHRFIVENSHMGIFVVDDNYRVVYANKALENIIGYELDEITGSDFRNYVAPVDTDKVIESYIRRQEGDVFPNIYEVNVLRKDGAIKTVEISVAVTRSSSDSVLTVVQVFDITDHKKLEQEFKKSENKYRDLFENVFDLIYTHDLEGNFTETNVHYLSEKTAVPEKVASSNLKDLIPEGFRSKFDEYLKRIIKNKKDEGLITIQIPGGEERTLEYKNSLICDNENNSTGVWGAARDITEHLKAKDALIVSEGRYRTVLEEIEEGYCEADLAGNVVFINQAALDAVGYSEEEMLSMNYKDIYSPEDQVRVFQAFHQVYETGEPFKDLVVEVIKKDGTPRQHEMSVILIRDRDGNPTGFRGIARDITARKEEEEKLKQAYAELDRRVMERTAELAKINKVLEAKSKGLSEANTALRVLLEKKDEAEKAIEERMVFNVMEAVFPMLEKLKGGRLPAREQVYVELIEEQLNKITSPFSQSLSMQFRKLTPTEIQIANLIKHGKKTKEIAELTCLAQSTIESHRKNIRKKFEIDNQKVNLRTYLLSLAK